ncbi:MAG: hypothetical protein SGILL_010099 [Bacillariaceae sp.]
MPVTLVTDGVLDDNDQVNGNDCTFYEDIVCTQQGNLDQASADIVNNKYHDLGCRIPTFENGIPTYRPPLTEEDATESLIDLGLGIRVMQASNLRINSLRDNLDDTQQKEFQIFRDFTTAINQSFGKLWELSPIVNDNGANGSVRLRKSDATTFTRAERIQLRDVFARFISSKSSFNGQTYLELFYMCASILMYLAHCLHMRGNIKPSNKEAAKAWPKFNTVKKRLISGMISLMIYVCLRGPKKTNVEDNLRDFKMSLGKPASSNVYTMWFVVPLLYFAKQLFGTDFDIEAIYEDSPGKFKYSFQTNAWRHGTYSFGFLAQAAQRNEVPKWLSGTMVEMQLLAHFLYIGFAHSPEDKKERSGNEEKKSQEDAWHVMPGTVGEAKSRYFTRRTIHIGIGDQVFEYAPLQTVQFDLTQEAAEDNAAEAEFDMHDEDAPMEEDYDAAHMPF